MTPPLDKSTESVIVATSPEFLKDIQTLKKRYRSIRKDIRPILEQIQKGQLLGKRIAGTGFVVYKVRVRNRDIKKGKSAGYRIIYQLESQNSVVLLRIYSKSDIDSVSSQSISEVIADFERAKMTNQ